jgi:myosin-5
VDKYEKLERKSKGFEEKLKEPTVPLEKWQALEVERDTWMNDHKQLADQLKTKTRDMDDLTAKLETQTQESGKLKLDLDEANDKIKTMVDAATVTELKSQISALKAQLSQALHAPRRQPSSTTMHNSSSSSLAPGGSNNARSVSPIMSPSTSIIKQQKQQHDEQQKEKASHIPSKAPAKPSINDAQSPASPTPGLSRARVGGRRNSSAEQTETQPKTSLDATLQKSKIASKTPRPTSVDQYSKILGAKSIHHEGDLDEDSLAEVKQVVDPTPFL